MGKYVQDENKKQADTGARAFLALDTIRAKFGMTDQKWAELAGLGYGSRISELRRRAALIVSGRVTEAKKIRRSISFSKIVALYLALKTTLGGHVVKSELVGLWKKATDVKEKIMLGSLLLTDKQAEAVEEYMEAMIDVSLDMRNDKNGNGSE